MTFPPLADGTCPTEPIMYRFLETVEREPGALAVSRQRERSWRHCPGQGTPGATPCSLTTAQLHRHRYTARQAWAAQACSSAAT